MDPGKLPRRLLFDTGVATRAFDPSAIDEASSACRALAASLIQHHRGILIAAPTLAEFIRKDGARTIPRVPSIEVVTFDEIAAQILGRQMPMSVLKEVRDRADGATLTHLKYDALIVACAARHAAECIVALDPDIALLAQYVGLHVYRPENFERAQTTLPL